MVLDAEQVAAAIASGCTFEPATPAAVQRLSMQRKVFTIDGRPFLASRGDGLYETAGTLSALIEQGREVMAYFGQPPAAAARAEAAPEAAAAPAEEAAAPAEAVMAEGAGAEAEPAKARAAAPQRRPRKPRAAPEAREEAAPPGPADLSPEAVLPRFPLGPGRAARRGGRWLTAGAERRGRREQHWSARQK
ncbi:hypothetical protein [Siccirubricoccus phaeus]|uniref:hypothetical protein n=1 Tax=Siccirubricoccus phaeus TaxID=2595053 RepID=UPI00165CA972|nr:hypothetical protein [Siccirubricoccus phaeus]